MSRIERLLSALLLSVTAVACAGVDEPPTDESEQAATTRTSVIAADAKKDPDAHATRQAASFAAEQPDQPGLFCDLCHAQGCYCATGTMECFACGLRTK